MQDSDIIKDAADLDWQFPDQPARKALIGFINLAFDGTAFDTRMQRDAYIARLAPDPLTRSRMRVLMLTGHDNVVALRKRNVNPVIRWLLDHHACETAPTGEPLHPAAIAQARNPRSQ